VTCTSRCLSFRIILGSSFSALLARRDKFVAGRNLLTYSFGDVWITDVYVLLRAVWNGMTSIDYSRSGLRKMIYRSLISTV
jgi:hypothetical protein